MAQDIFSAINPAATSGTQLAALLNDFKDAYVSGNSGTSRPAELETGGCWVDTTNAGSPNFYLSYKFFDGTNDVEVFRVNLSTSTSSIAGADSSFLINKVSADTTAAILQLAKARIASSGQVLDGDVVGEIQFIGHASDNSSPVVARLRAVSTDNMTSSAQGAMFTWEAMPDGAASISEMMRLMNGFLGVGITQPTHTIHARGSTGIKSERYLDDATGAKLITKKRRITGDGVSNADVVGSLDINSTDSSATEFTAAQVVATALENHTSANRGTKLEFKMTKALTNTLFTAVAMLTSTLEVFLRLVINGYKLVEANVATSASITALSADAALVNFTGSTATSLKGIDATGLTKVITLHNNSSASITVEHEDSGATSTNRIKLPDSAAIILTPGNSLGLFYSDADSRWKIQSSAGGSGGYSITSVESITGSGNISMSTTVKRQLRHVQGSGGAVTTATTPFGSSAPQDGTEITLVGNSDANSVSIPFNDAAKGAVGNFETIELTKYKVATFIYSSSLDRYVLLQGAV